VTVLVCGGRKYSDAARVASALGKIHKATPITRLVHGNAGGLDPALLTDVGADRLAGIWAAARGIDVQPYPADWDKFGRAAGPMRNQIMLDAERPQLCVAFPGGKGTADMIARSERAGVPVHLVPGRHDFYMTAGPK
jgi:hypothetical protein